MPDYKVITAEKTKDHPDASYGPMQTISLTLDVDGQIKGAEWYAKATTPIPQAGTFISGTLENDPKWGLKFKKAPAGGGFGSGGGGGGKNDPKTQAMISRQNSQSQALRYAELRHQQGKLPADFSLDDLAKVIEWFNADVRAAGEGAA